MSYMLKMEDILNIIMTLYDYNAFLHYTVRTTIIKKKNILCYTHNDRLFSISNEICIKLEQYIVFTTYIILNSLSSIYSTYLNKILIYYKSIRPTDGVIHKSIDKILIRSEEQFNRFSHL